VVMKSRISLLFIFLLSAFAGFSQDDPNLRDKVMNSIWLLVEPQEFPLYEIGDYVEVYHDEVLVYTRKEGEYSWILLFGARLDGNDLILELRDVSPLRPQPGMRPEIPSDLVLRLRPTNAESDEGMFFIPRKGLENQPKTEDIEGF
ncbi:MAG: hypothetical protein LPK46_07345, partial [Bacteroidota bacterium]|nr:hypothetical protein [Bacteroidota bacterium]MDX5505936.1 hypothetical protein [Bacteroidota bacterium]